MRRFLLLTLAGAGFAALVASGPASASGRCPPRAECVTATLRVQLQPRTVTFYMTENRTEYRDVQRTVLRQFPEVREREVQETVMVPCWRDVVRERTKMVPQVHMETRQRTVVHTDYREEERERTILVPVTEEVERSYKVCVPDVREELRTRTVLVPSVREEERERAVTTVHCVPEVVCKPVERDAHVAVTACDPCTGRRAVSCATAPQIDEETVTVNRRVAETHLEHYTKAVPCLRPEKQTVKVCVPSSHEEVRTESVPVTTLKPHTETYTVRVPVRHEEMETYEVPVTELVPQKEIYHEQVPGQPAGSANTEGDRNRVQDGAGGRHRARTVHDVREGSLPGQGVGAVRMPLIV